jgi:hypothetical protein
MEGKDLPEVNELLWEAVLSDGSNAVGKDANDIAVGRKSTARKIEIAAELELKTSAPSTWTAKQLNMGSPQMVGSYVKRLQNG